MYDIFKIAIYTYFNMLIHFYFKMFASIGKPLILILKSIVRVLNYNSSNYNIYYFINLFECSGFCQIRQNGI